MALEKQEDVTLGAKNRGRLVEKRDLILLLTLLGIALVIGIYQIATTVLIAKDGVFYIERAQKFATDPIGVIRGRCPFGYPFLVFMAHSFVGLFGSSSSVYSWIYSAQGITLLCRLLALIPLYFMGKLLVGSRKSFWALAVLLVLPYPAEIGVDVLREWPYTLFLAAGFFFLLLASKEGKPWIFGLAGLATGAGYLIRLECSQIILYGAAWLFSNMLWPVGKMTRAKSLLAIVLLAAGFLIAVGPYMRIRGKVLPYEFKYFIHYNRMSQLNETAEVRTHTDVQIQYKAEWMPGRISRGLGDLINSICEAMLYVFVPFWGIGFWSYLKKKRWRDPRSFYVSALFLFNSFVFVWLYHQRDHNSARHILPVILLTIFYVPVGLQIVLSRFSKSSASKDTEALEVQNRRWFYILLIAGMAICIPKLVRPIRIDKKSYRTASNWLKENTNNEDIIIATEHRIPFYAQRRYSRKCNRQSLKKSSYFINIHKDSDEALPSLLAKVRMRREYELDLGIGNKKLAVYKISWRKEGKDVNRQVYE